MTLTGLCHLRAHPGRCAAWLTPFASASIRRCYVSLATPLTRVEQNANGARPSKIIYSDNQPTELPERASKLLAIWHISASKKGITRRYAFSSFNKAWKFMSLIAEECKIKKHHPSWSNLYNEVCIEWTTHDPEGLSIKDIEMAEFCDITAAEIGQKKPIDFNEI